MNEAQVTAASSILDAARFFHDRGWLLGTCGNLSVKLSDEPQRILVTPSGKDKSRLREGDLLVVDGQGNLLEGSGKATAELSVHHAVYALTSARAVYHVHSISNNLASHLWASQGFVHFEGIEMIKGLTGKTLSDRVLLPIVANSNDMGQLAANVVKGLRLDVAAVLVERHGIYAWGQDPDEARRHVEILEFLLEFTVRLASLSPAALFPSNGRANGVVAKGPGIV